MAHPTPTLTPQLVETAAEAIEAFAGLLLCVDPARWDSAARPTPRALAALLYAAAAPVLQAAAEADPSA